MSVSVAEFDELVRAAFEELPEVGDPEKPGLVFFFDEAHLLFDDAPDVLLEGKTVEKALLNAARESGATVVSSSFHRFDPQGVQNLGLVQFVRDPGTVDHRAAWPEALKMAERAGADTLFRSLRSVLGSGDFFESSSLPKKPRGQKRQLLPPG